MQFMHGVNPCICGLTLNIECIEPVQKASMFNAIKKLFSRSTVAESVNRRQSMARNLMEAAQTRAAHNAREAQELRSAAVQRLSVIR